MHTPIALRREHGYWRGQFTAMANPCEVLAETEDAAQARRMTEIAAAEALRIERKFSRYRDDSVVHAINSSRGAWIEVDAETAQLIDFGVTLWQLSDGAFDLTSGVLRRIWKFAPGAVPPAAEQIQAIMKSIGWQRVEWQAPRLRMPDGMELDFGGIGKEYAVDRVASLLSAESGAPALVNFGGDLRSVGPTPKSGAWQVGIESITAPDQAGQLIQLTQGALATSGDTRRALMHQGRRYGHIIDARTGWPPSDAPHSITVISATCTQAGTYTTLAMLQGEHAESFLEAEGVQYWCLR